MPYYPYAVETGAIYKLTNPNGAVAVFNDPTDVNYVGMLTEVTGLDSPEVRESADDLVEADGGTHGNFYFGRRPIVLNGRVFGHNSVSERAARLDRARRASMAVRADSTLSWKPSDTTDFYVEMFTTVRRQQPFRETGAWNKDFQIALVSEFAPLFSVAQRTATGAAGSAVSAENQGSWPAYPLLRMTGASAANPTVTNNTTGAQFKTLGGLLIAAGETLEVDTLNHTAKFIAGARNGQSANRFIDFGGITNWPSIATGTSTFTMSGTGSLTVVWRDTWI